MGDRFARGDAVIAIPFAENEFQGICRTSALLDATFPLKKHLHRNSKASAALIAALNSNISLSVRKQISNGGYVNVKKPGSKCCSNMADVSSATAMLSLSVSDTCCH